MVSKGGESIASIAPESIEFLGSQGNEVVLWAMDGCMTTGVFEWPVQRSCPVLLLQCQLSMMIAVVLDAVLHRVKVLRAWQVTHRPSDA